MLVTLASQFLSNFCPTPPLYTEIPYFYTKIPVFYAEIYLFGFHCAVNVRGWVSIGHIWSVFNDDVRTMSGLWEGGGRWWKKQLRKCALKIIMARYLLRQAKALSWIPVRLPAPQGTGKESSMDHAVVQHRDHGFKLDISPSTYVWNGFLYIFRHEST